MGRRRKTYTDGNGTLRFVPNRVVRDLLDAAKAGRQLDLNAIWADYCDGRYAKAEMQEFYQLINYSISGYDEINFDRGEA
jgi:uncharacterized protein YqfA (UPF0365 family)